MVLPSHLKLLRLGLNLQSFCNLPHCWDERLLTLCSAFVPGKFVMLTWKCKINDKSVDLEKISGMILDVGVIIQKNILCIYHVPNHCKILVVQLGLHSS